MDDAHIASDDAASAAAQAFIAKWEGVTASELSTSQSFLIDLCALLGVDTPHATPEQDYMFERPITFQHGDGSTSAGRIDLYRRGAFVLESKKGHGVKGPRPTMRLASLDISRASVLLWPLAPTARRL